MAYRFACAGLLLGLFSPVLSAAPTSEVTFEQRVAAQRAIEQVYWEHRIWPKENATTKPPLTAVLPEAAIRAKVEDTLLKSNALDRFWHRPISAAGLQAELDRIVRDSKDPAMLREMFAALGNDASLIAETLARQTLADRLLRGWYASDARFHRDVKERAQAALRACADAGCMKTMGGRYTETTWNRRDGAPADDEARVHSLENDEWHALLDRWTRKLGGTPTALPVLQLGRLEETAEGFSVGAVLAQRAGTLTVASVVWEKEPFDTWWLAQRGGLDGTVELPAAAYAVAAPAAGGCADGAWAETAHGLDPRVNHKAVWTGAEMIVWGGTGEGGSLATGGRYTAATDSWVEVSRGANAPASRYGHTSVWTGTEMIVWGGQTFAPGQPAVDLQSGARYNPSTDSWRPTAVAANTPLPRRSHVAVWTGSQMIVWGGIGGGTTGGRYDPVSDTWTPTALAGAPAARYFHTAVWTGSEMIVWGGFANPSALNSGGRYNPVSDSWQPTSITGSTPAGAYGHTVVWTGTQMIVWGGSTGTAVVDAGSRYVPSTDSWTQTSTGANTPTPRLSHTAVWTGTEMIVFGGQGSSGADLDTGGRYQPATNTWATTARQNTAARSQHTAVWTGAEMIVWGGEADQTALSSGGRYSPESNSWVATASTSIVEPGARAYHSTVWTGAEMIVWGGQIRDSSVIATGGRYVPLTDSWIPTSANGSAPSHRYYHTAVWTGTRMIVWGGSDGTNLVNTGGRYDPVTDSWQATKQNGSVPSPRLQHVAIWTGVEMVIWGGSASGSTNTGARYSPSSDSWTPTSLAGAPSPRGESAAVWTGSEMIVWGGSSGASESGPIILSTGGRYRPGSDTWLATSQGANVPQARHDHTAVWTGTEMIVWGGLAGPSDQRVNTGSRYDPVADSWSATSIAPDVPSARAAHSAIWTGTQMIVWGGSGPSALESTGGQYNPSGDSWLATSVEGPLPSPRVRHGAVWTGAQMIVWGGANGGSEGGPSVLGTGGLYCPESCASPATYYRDADGDGYGDSSVTQVGCFQPSGYVPVGGDVCPFDFDPAQADFDHDGQGDLCDVDDGLVYLTAPDKTHIQWQAELGPIDWDLYEGDLDVLRASGVYTQAVGSNVLANRRCGLNVLVANDLTPVPSGSVKLSLVTGVITGSLGTDSQGVERPNTNPCP